MKNFSLYAPLSGILGPGIIGLGMLITGLAYVGVEGQAYSMMNHFVSELGELGVSELAPVFNGSLILGGMITMVFMIYLASQFEHWTRYPLGVLSVIAALSGSLVGIFPMNSLEPHVLAAMTFFNLGMLISFLYSTVILLSKRHPFPKWLAIPGFVNAATFTLFLYFPSEINVEVDFQEGMAGLVNNRPDFIPLALMEWIVILGILIWISWIGVYLVKNRMNPAM
jgi:hypothetical membrane protein